MCGLSAIFDPHGGAAAHVAAMTQLVRHRGPDDEGYVLIDPGLADARVLCGPDTPASVRSGSFRYTRPQMFAPEAAGDARVALGHRRLSIVDLSAAGHQPMATRDGRVWVVYNGEIYNHVELRLELERDGARFVSGSDTEVLLAAWRRWGADALAHFNGMFAFVLVDLDRRVAFAARDRFGVKPLYFWRAPGGAVAFASEVKQFSALPGWRARLARQAAYDYLAWSLFDHTGGTMFDGVGQLRGGESVELSLDRLSDPLAPRRWYSLAARAVDVADGGAAEIFGAAFTDAVRLRLRADVPVGSCLSGGLDSSSIVCVANRLLRDAGVPAAQKTFSAASRVARFDERRYAEEVIAATGVESHFVYPQAEEMLAELDRLIWHQDEPFGSSSIYAQWCVFGLAARHDTRVMLDGQGADEILAGYPGFYAPLLGGLARSMRWMRLARECAAVARSPGLGAGYAVKQLANTLLPDWLRQPLRRSAGVASTEPPWLDVTRLGVQPREPFPPEAGDGCSLASLSRRLLLDTGVPMLLHTEDRNSMAHSVESRVPFLDYRLVELTLGLPDEAKLAGGVSKRVLRESMRGLLPEAVRLRRDKLGFATPEEVWLRETLTPRFRALIVDAIEAAAGILRPRALAEFDAVVAGARRFSFEWWRMIAFGAWVRRFGVDVGAGKPV